MIYIYQTLLKFNAPNINVFSVYKIYEELSLDYNFSA